MAEMNTNNDWTAQDDDSEPELTPPQQDDELDADTIINDENLDPNAVGKDQKPPKRRGRPPKTRHNSDNPANDDHARAREMNQLKEELDLVKRKNLDLKTKLNNSETLLGSLEEELDTAKGLLLEKEQDYENLLKEFASQADTVENPKGLIIHDDVAKAIATKILSTATNVDWETEQCSIENLSDLKEGDIINKGIDVIIIIAGTKDLMNGRSVAQTFSDIKSALDRLCSICQIMITTAPPNMAKSVQVSLLNHKINTLDVGNSSVQVVNIPPKGLRSTLLKDDGVTLSDRCIDSYISELLERTKSISKKQRKCSTEQFEVQAVMPIKAEMIGRVIGKGGNVIKRITEETNVSMTLGKWSESSAKGREEPAFDGVLISGLSGNVRHAMSMVREIVNRETRESEPTEKKRKF